MTRRRPEPWDPETDGKKTGRSHHGTSTMTIGEYHRREEARTAEVVRSRQQPTQQIKRK